MHSTLSIASLLFAASGSLALPQGSYPSGGDTEVRVVLQSQATETGITSTFDRVDAAVSDDIADQTMFETIEIFVGADANQDLRCQALGLDGQPLVATRGENVDTTFSDGGPDKAEWTFQTPSSVSRVTCDPAFVQAAPGTTPGNAPGTYPEEGNPEEGNPEDFQVRITLATDDLATQTVFENFSGRAASPPTGSSGPYTSVDILVGSMVNPDLRCKLIDRRGRTIIATRGENIDTTFSDGGPDKGEWTFQDIREGRNLRQVRNIICDETFVAEPQQVTVA